MLRAPSPTAVTLAVGSMLTVCTCLYKSVMHHAAVYALLLRSMQYTITSISRLAERLYSGSRWHSPPGNPLGQDCESDMCAFVPF